MVTGFDILAGTARDELDGVLLLANMLMRGVTVEALPRQVLIAESSSGEEFSFVHGIPGASGLSSVTFAQDKRMRRALMERSDIPVPKGATFTMGAGTRGAQEFASRIGYPVTLKPAVGDNGIEAQHDIRNDAQLLDALKVLMLPTSHRPNFSRASYGLTELREPGMVNGELTVPPGYQFLVEKQTDGDYVRFLVLDGKIVSALLCSGYPSDLSLTAVTDVTDQVGDDLANLVVRASRVIPGLRVIALDVIVPASGVATRKSERATVVEYSERPGLWVQGVLSPQVAVDLAGKILEIGAPGVPEDARHAGVAVSYRLDAYALPDPNGSVEYLEEGARERGLAVEFGEVDQLGGTVSMVISGEPLAIAALVDALLAGKVGGVPVMRIRLTPKVI